MALVAETAQQPFTAPLKATPIGHHLAMIADQGSFFFPFEARHPQHTQGFILAPQIAI